MIATALEAKISPDREEELVNAYSEAVSDLPSSVAETFLMHVAETDVWRIVTLWRSQGDLDAYRASVDVPRGIRIFRSVDAEPTLSQYEVVEYATE